MLLFSLKMVISCIHICMKTIPLTRGYEALVDDEDFDWLSQFSWHYTQSSITETGYARRFEKVDGKKVYTTMHREILNLTGRGVNVDHKNHNGLDNQKENLRVCTLSQNLQNRRVCKTEKNHSKYKGVCLSHGRPNRPKKWRAYIGVNRKTIHLGFFVTEEEAARAYDEAALKYFREFACINFPPESVQHQSQAVG